MRKTLVFNNLGDYIGILVLRGKELQECFNKQGKNNGFEKYVLVETNGNGWRFADQYSPLTKALEYPILKARLNLNKKYWWYYCGDIEEKVNFALDIE